MSKTPPSHKDRKKCWKARDEYFACLNTHNLWLHGLSPQSYTDILAIDPTNTNISTTPLTRAEKNNLNACKKMLSAFEKECLPSWVINRFFMLGSV